jgi:hypothetical protein
MTLFLSNIVLVYFLTKQLSAKPEVGYFAALLSSFHIRMTDLYYSSGTLYDLLAASLMLGALLLYVRLRSRRQKLSYPQIGVLTALFLGAIGSKELAAVLPVVLLAWELLWKAPADRRYGVCALLFAISAVFTVSRTGGQGPLAGVAAYATDLSPSQVLLTTARYLDQFLLLPDGTLTRLQAAGILALALAIPLLFRSRLVLFGLVLLTAGSLPIMIIPPRGLFALYIPFLG